MKTIYYVFGTGCTTDYVSDTKCIYYLPDEDYEEMIDLSMMDSLHEPVTIFFVGVNDESRRLAQICAQRYDCQTADSLS